MVMIAVAGDGAAAQRLGVGQVHARPYRSMRIVEFAARADKFGFSEACDEPGM
jgi:hypothetical protein